MNLSTLGLPVHYQLPEFTQTHVHRVSDAIQPLILCCPLLLLPSIFPSIKVFSNESALPIRWPKYWSFSFNISPSNEHLGLIGKRSKLSLFTYFIVICFLKSNNLGRKIIIIKRKIYQGFLIICWNIKSVYKNQLYSMY